MQKRPKRQRKIDESRVGERERREETARAQAYEISVL